ncbi:hypothetical protein HYDPIDRAFT_87182 [Hydnomerulius pinastri MD-312]|nr:hypothetical protein HYDPIDRAFT_87182 [Hydnomerulius pinastri MD-312]
MAQLPSSFKSLYRLVLRTTSASVLHHTTPRRSIRKLWRPVFDGAVQAIRNLQDHQLPQSERLRCEQSLDIFQRRMDNTLTLLSNSASSRGLSHQVVRNLNLLRNAHVRWVRSSYYSQRWAWQPQLPPTAPEYSSKSLIPKSNREATLQAQRRQSRQTDERCWNALGEAVKMAESRHGLLLGRIRLKRWTVESP